MNAYYRHTQMGKVMLGVLFPIVLFIIVMSSLEGWKPLHVTILGVLGLVGVVFCSLGVEIDRGQLRCWFGPGLIRRTFALSDITAAEPVRNRWYYGWGIRRVPGCWMFNVSGLDAVEIALASGVRFRIGTDEPQELAKAIRRNLPPSA